MALSLIVAMAKNRVIGYENKMPWHLPAELAYFKRVTMGHPIIMGRKTFESIGRPLPGRRNIVVSRNANFRTAGAEVTPSLNAAIELTRRDAFIIGGASLYRDAIAHVDRIYLTEIDAMPTGDTFFPALDEHEWITVSHESRASDEKNPLDIAFTVLERVTP
jgi:dihydrofolate reductase